MCRALIRLRNPWETAPALSTRFRVDVLYSLKRSSTRFMTSGPRPWKDRAYRR